MLLSTSGGRARQTQHLGVGPVGEIEPLQPVIGRGEAEPGLGIARLRLGGTAEIALGQPIIAVAEEPLGHAEIVVGIAAQQRLGRPDRRPASGVVDGRSADRAIDTSQPAPVPAGAALDAVVVDLRCPAI